MPRMPRLWLEGFPLHVVQRGNDRQACFRADGDRRHYLALLRDLSRRYDCSIHAYVLMSNHVHLLMTPHRRGGASSMMQTLGRRYVGAFNARYVRTGTLWEGRFKSSLVGGAAYVMACYRYIELNPVRAGMATAPSEYRWSSYRANAMGHDDPLVTPHEAYLALGERGERLDAYRNLVTQALADDMLDAIRANLQQGRALSPNDMQTGLEARTGQCVRLRSRGHQPGEAPNARVVMSRILRK